MNMNKFKAIKVAAILAIVSSAVLGADVKNQIVLIRTYISTNTIPGYIGGPDVQWQTNSAGIIMPQPVPAVAITHPPRTEIVTNYVLGYYDGTNAVELITAEKR